MTYRKELRDDYVSEMQTNIKQLDLALMNLEKGDEKLTIEKMQKKKKKNKVKVGKKGAILFLVVLFGVFAVLYPTIDAMVVFEGDVSQSEAEQAIFDAEQVMLEMQTEGFNVLSVNDTIYLAYEALQRADFAQLISENATSELALEAQDVLAGLNHEDFTYEQVVEYADQVYDIQSQAYALRDAVRAMEIKVEFYAEEGYNVTTVEQLLVEAQEEFEKERYLSAESLLVEAETMLEDERSNVTKLELLGRSGKSFFVNNWYQILIVLVVVSLLTLLIYKVGRKRMLKRKLIKLQHEVNSLKELMKDTQVERYHLKTLAKSTYDRRMKYYQERMERVKARIPVLKKMIGAKKKVKRKPKKKVRKKRRKKR